MSRKSAFERLILYDPATRSTRVVVKGLSFANGVALSNDEQTLFVAEIGRYRIWKVAVIAQDLAAGSGSPQAMVLLDNLPGYPDNLMRGADGAASGWASRARPRLVASRQ